MSMIEIVSESERRSECRKTGHGRNSDSDTKRSDAGSLKDVDARRSQKPTFEFSCVYALTLSFHTEQISSPLAFFQGFH
jgi:hypothetical protein